MIVKGKHFDSEYDIQIFPVASIVIGGVCGVLGFYGFNLPIIGSIVVGLVCTYLFFKRTSKVLVPSLSDSIEKIFSKKNKD